ncbi:hypothetical protein, partial [Arsenophonus apicola]|uniref:hypothetical protein n=1 Tax=Arsenophonus apicola TaxID=2879119 RepID=UPI0038794C07
KSITEEAPTEKSPTAAILTIEQPFLSLEETLAEKSITEEAATEKSPTAAIPTIEQPFLSLEETLPEKSLTEEAPTEKNPTAEILTVEKLCGCSDETMSEKSPIQEAPIEKSFLTESPTTHLPAYLAPSLEMQTLRAAVDNQPTIINYNQINIINLNGYSRLSLQGNTINIDNMQTEGLSQMMSGFKNKESTAYDSCDLKPAFDPSPRMYMPQVV